MKTLGFIVALVASNFLYQWAFRDQPDWSVAFDRSYFQAIAIGLFAFSR